MRYRPIPTSLHGALEADKDEGIHKRRMSVERMAEHYGNRPKTVYDWIEEASIPANRLKLWFDKTGGKYTIRFLCAQAGGLFIELPTGKQSATHEVSDLQLVLHDAVGALLAYHAGKLEQDACLAKLTHAMECTAWHRENVRKAEQPELEFGA